MNVEIEIEADLNTDRTKLCGPCIAAIAGYYNKYAKILSKKC